jgi:hypothetical protein
MVLGTYAETKVPRVQGRLLALNQSSRSETNLITLPKGNPTYFFFARGCALSYTFAKC